MKKRVQHLLSSLLVLCMAFTLYSLPVSATEAASAETGTKDNPWNISAEEGSDNVIAWYEGSEQNGYTLFISGEGRMTASFRSDAPPWKSIKSNITTVEIGEGVTNVGAYAFNFCRALKNVSLPDSLTEIGTYAFHSTGVKHLTIPANVQTIGRMIANPTTYYEVLGNPNSVDDHAFNTSLVSVPDQATAEALNPKTNVSAIIVLNDGIYGESEEDLANLSYGLIAPVKEGYSFNGWYQSADCSGQPLSTDSNGRTTTNINNIYYAKWEDAPEATPTPTPEPTPTPTPEPSSSPSPEPSNSPSPAPSGSPSPAPSGSPSPAPSGSPSPAPSGSATAAPTLEPSGTPTAAPTLEPSGTPTAAPTDDYQEVPAPANAESVKDAIKLPDGYTLRESDSALALIPGGYVTVTATSKDGSVITYKISKDPELIIEDNNEYETASGQKPIKYYEISKDGELVIKSTGVLDRLQKVMIDGQVVAESNYTLKSGSTILTFKKDYLDTLSVGDHDLELTYEVGKVEVLLKVSESAPPTNSGNTTDQTDSQDSASNEAEKSGWSTFLSPKTGDYGEYGISPNVWLLFIAIAAAAVLLGTYIIVLTRRKHNNDEGRKER